MKNRRREINEEPGEFEVSVYLEDTTRSLLEKLGLHKVWFIADRDGRSFLDNDHLFAYMSSPNPQPLRVKQGLQLDAKKTREATKPEDKREAVLVQFGDLIYEFKKNECKAYQEAVHRARVVFNLTEAWKIATVRAEEDRIVIVWVKGSNPFWDAEKAYPPLEIAKDRVRNAAISVPAGTWVIKKPAPAPRL
jgi:hypothetical protein